ncbi:MAG: tISRso11b [Cellvibrio sp.]|nr:tISRso11b [Cellvibrio sp.]
MSLRKRGHLINHKTVQKLMSQSGLKSTVRPKRYKSYRGSVGKVAPNRLAREFSASAPGEKWVTDVTEFNVNGEKVYLSPIIDLYNSEVIAYQIQSRPTYDLVGQMLARALKRLKPMQAPLIHSDQGWHYQMPAFKRALNARGLEQERFIQELKAYIRYYNYDRIKLKLKGLSPVQYRLQSFN